MEYIVKVHLCRYTRTHMHMFHLVGYYTCTHLSRAGYRAVDVNIKMLFIWKAGSMSQQQTTEQATAYSIQKYTLHSVK